MTAIALRPLGQRRGCPPNSDLAFGEAPDGSVLVGGTLGLYRLSGNRFERLPGPFNRINRPGHHSRMEKATPFLAPTPDWWSSIPKPGQDGFCHACLPWCRERPMRPPMGFLWMAMFCGTAAEAAVPYGCPWNASLRARNERLPGQELLGIQKDGAGNLWVSAQVAGIFFGPPENSGFQRPICPVYGWSKHTR